jgi:sodium/proline symporter
LVSIIGILIALDETSVIFTIVSFAWAGFGATFGPIMLFSIFWRRTTWPAAISGMLSGAAVVFIWKLLIKPLGAQLGISAFGIYELLPAFVISCLVIVVVSLATRPPSEEITSRFDRVHEVIRKKDFKEFDIVQ